MSIYALVHAIVLAFLCGPPHNGRQGGNYYDDEDCGKEGEEEAGSEGGIAPQGIPCECGRGRVQAPQGTEPEPTGVFPSHRLLRAGYRQLGDGSYARRTGAAPDQGT